MEKCEADRNQLRLHGSIPRNRWMKSNPQQQSDSFEDFHAKLAQVMKHVQLVFPKLIPGLKVEVGRATSENPYRSGILPITIPTRRIRKLF